MLLSESEVEKFLRKTGFLSESEVEKFLRMRLVSSTSAGTQTPRQQHLEVSRI